MEGTIGEVRMFAGTFAPRNWSTCSGQTLPLSAYTTLYAIIGTNYGGDGKSTFKLPDLQGRTIVGKGQGPGLSEYNLGESVGSEFGTIGMQEMPAHIHGLTYVPAAAGTATLTIKASADESGNPTPTGNFLGAPSAASENIYGIPQGMVQVAPMADGTLSVGSVTGPQLTTLGLALTGSPATAIHENRQPSLALNYLICLFGTFPARD